MWITLRCIDHELNKNNCPGQVITKPLSLIPLRSWVMALTHMTTCAVLWPPSDLVLKFSHRLNSAQTKYKM